MVGVLRFATPASVLPDKHYVLQLGSGSEKLVVDFTGQQFSQWPVPKAFLGKWEDWERYFTRLDHNLETIILSAVFDSPGQAGRELGRLSRGGVQSGVFVDVYDYRVLRCPTLWEPQLERQMLRLWEEATQVGSTTAQRDTLYMLMSNVEVMHRPAGTQPAALYRTRPTCAPQGSVVSEFQE